MKKLKWPLRAIRYVLCDDGDVPISTHCTYAAAEWARDHAPVDFPEQWTIHECNAFVVIERAKATPPVRPERAILGYKGSVPINDIGNSEIN